MIQDYTIEVRKKILHTNVNPELLPTYEWQGTIDQRIKPAYTQELGTADELTFSMFMSDPKIEIFADENSAGLEVWLYGRDRVLKQVFVISMIELIRDYGASSLQSGSGSLGGGSGDTVLITCTGVENYLSRYIVQNYKIYQRMTEDVIMDITQEAMQDAVFSIIDVDPSLNMSLDVDLSWENAQTAIGNIIAQTGGYMQIYVDPSYPSYRVLQLRPLPGGVNQPKDIGMTSPIIPQ